MGGGGAAAGTAYHAYPYHPYMYPHPGMSPGGKQNEPLKKKRGRPSKRKKRNKQARAEVPAVCTPDVQIVHIYRREHEIQLLHGRCTARALQSARDRLLYLFFDEDWLSIAGRTKKASNGLCHVLKSGPALYACDQTTDM